MSNACGTVALVHAYAAFAAEAGGAAGTEGWLGGFVSRTAGMTSVERAAALEEDEALAVSHNDMARQVPPPQLYAARDCPQLPPHPVLKPILRIPGPCLAVDGQGAT